jgi:Mrp family chromosome partitioning ATPase
MMHMAQMLEVPLLGIVENMGYAVCPHCGEKWELYGPSHVEKLSEKWKVPVIAGLPVDREISILGDAGRLEHYANEAVLENLADGVLKSLK